MRRGKDRRRFFDFDPSVAFVFTLAIIYHTNGSIWQVEEIEYQQAADRGV